MDRTTASTEPAEEREDCPLDEQTLVIVLPILSNGAIMEVLSSEAPSTGVTVYKDPPVRGTGRNVLLHFFDTVPDERKDPQYVHE